MRKRFFKKLISAVLTAAVVFTSVPATFVAAEETAAPEAIEVYDFADFAAGENDTLTDGSRTITLESYGTGVKPILTTDASRGQVMQLTLSDYNNRAYGLISNPFAGADVSNGLTLNFWTATLSNWDGASTLVDFEVAPATTGRAGTVAVTQSRVWWNTTDQNGNFMDFGTDALGLNNINVWTMVTMVVTSEGIAFYSNGEKIEHTIEASSTSDYDQLIRDLAGTSGICEHPSETNVRFGASLATYWNGANALLDDVSFYGKALTEDEINALWDATVVKVPAESITISGSASVVQTKEMQLTASVAPAGATDAKYLTWTSSDESILSIDEDGKAIGLKPGKVTVTASIGNLKSNELEIEVTKLDSISSLESGYYLTVYSTTTRAYAYTSNIDQETKSVYMAVSADGKNFDVLNNGGGVIFSKNTKGTLQITEPMVYKNEEGLFTVVAPDADASKGYHVFTSENGVHYYDDTIVTADPYAGIPLKKDSFTLMLDGENILETDANITLGNALELTEEEYTYIVNKLGTVKNNGLEKLERLEVEGGVLTEEMLAEKYPTVTATYTDGSTKEFPVDWTGALEGVDVDSEGYYNATGSVVQTKYLNNLKELNGSTLPEDDPENENADFPSNYDPDTKTVYYDETKFIEGMADPNIFWDEETGYYYMTASYFPEEGDQIDENDNLQQYDRVVLRKAKTLEGLQDRSNQVTIWKVGNQGYDNNGTQVNSGYRYIWAPEIHRVGDYWVVYFTESHGGLFDIYCHALVLDGDMDPYETALTSSDEVSQWQDYKMVADAPSTINSINTAFCLDMTYFKDEESGTSYVCWAGKPTAAYRGGNTDLFIAEVDEYEPWKIISEQVRITKADYGWERVRYCVNEGATVLQHDGNIFMAYSVSGTGSEYAIGMLNAKAGADLLDPDNWTKSPYPVLTSRDVDGEEGPGHNSFTVDQDGNVIFVYHARPTSHNHQMCGWDGTKSSFNGEPLNDPCRHARLKRVHWAADGSPILKMTYEDELLEENQTVSLRIKVTSDAKKELPYEDVSDSDWFYDSVAYVYYTQIEGRGLMTGLDETHFGPYSQLSRAQFALILYRMEGEPKVETDKAFTDITGDEWYGQAVLWAAEAGVVNGYESGAFGPADNITREQMAIMMHRYAKYLKQDVETEATLDAFADAEKVSPFAVEGMKWAADKGIITGKDNDGGAKCIDPQGYTARCEAAAIIMRFLTK